MAVAAGSVALPTLLKLSEVLSAQKQDLNIGHQLPVEMELGKVSGNSCANIRCTMRLLGVCVTEPHTVVCFFHNVNSAMPSTCRVSSCTACLLYKHPAAQGTLRLAAH